MFAAGFQIEVDVDDSVTLNKKVRNAQLAQFNFILGNYLISLLSLKCFKTNWKDVIVVEIIGGNY